MNDLDLFQSLGIALALGLLIGLERGWHNRKLEEGQRTAGLRTFGLIGLLGGITAFLAREVGYWLLGVGLAGLVALVTVAYNKHSGRKDGIGFTSEVAAILAFVFGATVLLGYPVVASASAVIAVLLLSMKPVLHGLLLKLEEKELYAALKLLLISVVLLPILPDKGYGPWEVLNPYQIWWMVVLIAGISFIGYFSMKIGGPRHGALLTGLFGGLVSSTAVTLSLSRFSRTNPGIEGNLTSGILAACATMFLRIILVAIAVNPALFTMLAVPFGTASLLSYLAAFLFWKSSASQLAHREIPLQNPFQLGTAIKFGGLLAAILLLAEGIRTWLGDTGLYLLAAASGIADVDALTLSVSGMTLRDISFSVALFAIFIAATVNSLVKTGMAMSVGGRRLGLMVGLSLTGILLITFLMIGIVLPA